MIGLQTHRVVDERGVELAAEVFTWFQRKRYIIALLESAVVFICSLKYMRHPSNVVLRRHKLQTRETLQDTGKDQGEERVLNFVRPGNQVHPKLRHVALVNPTLSTTSGSEMQRQRHLQVLRGCPERVIQRRAIGSIFRR